MSTGRVRYDGRAILVTGAGRGMGRTHALALADRGAQVLVADRGVTMNGTGSDEGPANDVVAEIVAAGGTAVAYHGDLSTSEGAIGAVEAAIAAFGRIDGIIHNASTSPDAVPLYEMPEELFDRTARVNIYAAFLMVKAAWPRFIEQNFGRIVVVSSHSIYGTPQSVSYATAKAAYIGLVNSLSLEGVEHNILVNGIAPTARTRMTERMQASDYTDWLFETMLPERVTPTVAYLVSEAASVNGQFFSVGGGRVARITLAESHGVLGMGEDIDAVHDLLPSVMDDQDWLFPTSIFERGLIVGQLMGWEPSDTGGNPYEVSNEPESPELSVADAKGGNHDR
ncbi:SDR family NAD(P)-dependent oxidoreductase [Agreia sp. PsM10]|nr:SDR family NAD(P)-dependent oxidoreductase [Agreia sp. PsM10]MDN4640055.1 SDR family NAD(P)-dependent oxidoreductase [Agreia sp. PsM10]